MPNTFDMKKIILFIAALVCFINTKAQLDNSGEDIADPFISLDSYPIPSAGKLLTDRNYPIHTLYYIGMPDAMKLITDAQNDSDINIKRAIHEIIAIYNLNK